MRSARRRKSEGEETEEALHRRGEHRGNCNISLQKKTDADVTSIVYKTVGV